MLRPVRLPIALFAAALWATAALPGVAEAAADGPTAVAASACKTTPASLGAGYILLGKDRGVSCAATKQLEVGFQACRLTHGRSGRCTSKEIGYSCREGKRNYASASGKRTSFFSTVTCTKGKALFSWTYEQDLT